MAGDDVSLSRPMVLIVEDDPSMGQLLCALVDRMGYRFALRSTGEEAISFVRAGEPAAIVLDVGLPGADGLDVTRQLRVQGVRVPIVMVSGNTSPDDEVAGFAAGADEYIGKPFDADVFYARVRSAVRRGDGGHSLPRCLAVGMLRLDPVMRWAAWGDTRLPLTPVEFEVLRVVIEDADQVVTREDLTRRAWRGKVHEPSAVHVAMRRLRNKLALAGCSVTIQTVHSGGYRLTRPQAAFESRRERGPGRQ